MNERPHFMINRREFVAAAASLAAASLDAAVPGDSVIGPLVGHTTTKSAVLWARIPKEGMHKIVVRSEGVPDHNLSAEAKPENDWTVHWPVGNLAASKKYTVELAGGSPCHFTTPPAEDQPCRVTLAMGSCAKEDEGTRAVWTCMIAEKADAILLGGDTPYIDSTKLDVQRRRYREFATVPEFQQLVSTRPFWSTWDDHDFGKNDADGLLPGKENSRKAFTEYRAQSEYGDGKGGIYTSFRWGPIEVFVLDARWWSYTGPSFADKSKKTLLGTIQWEWLKKNLKASKAPFKILTCGMIWDDKENKEKDDWETYSHERTALFNFIKENRISGVLLFGGDIHVTRLLRYPTEYVGYPLYQFISSPMHASTIASLNVKHPHLVDSKLQPNTFLTLTADTTVKPATITARFLDRDGKSLFPDTTLTVDQLTAPAK